MNYDVIALACEQLSYRDKLRLAQLLIQTVRKEDEIETPQKRTEAPIKKAPQPIIKEDEIDTIEYVVKRLLKLKPTKIKSLTNSIKSIFQFQGGISGMVQNQGVLLNTRRASPCHRSSIKIKLTKLSGVKRLVETVDNPTAQASVNVAFLLRLQLVIYPPDADGSCAEKVDGLK